EAAIAVVRAMLPEGAEVERIPCSTPGHADDVVARVRGDGARRIVLLGHLDTVIPHHDHRPLTRDGDRLVGSGTVDMKGGDVLAAGVLRALAEGAGAPPFAEAALLLVNDEEWRMVPFAHAERFAGFDACLCFEAGQLGPGGEEAVVVKRKAAGTLRVRAYGRESHSGSAPDKGVSALLALAEAALAIAGAHDPHGDDALTAVPTIFRSGEAFNVVPAAGEVIADLRAHREEAFERVIASVPDRVGAARLEPEVLRRWPGMDARDSVAPLLARARAARVRPGGVARDARPRGARGRRDGARRLRLLGLCAIRHSAGADRLPSPEDQA
ncbi:MAG TPA: M20/M25/M40 family metallo-hydrolase, partial [Solirubrobacteraceae bacterium]|nr:M20/M25/M40 family metallo-hydrolase [Solirubrobacteraceae bacterium]